jgi:hypothetical protein
MPANRCQGKFELESKIFRISALPALITCGDQNQPDRDFPVTVLSQSTAVNIFGMSRIFLHYKERIHKNLSG